MKKTLQIFSVFVLILLVVGLANLDSVMASFTQLAPAQHGAAAPALRGAPVPDAGGITEDGIYNIEGICDFEVKYEPGSKLSGLVHADVDPEFSTNIPFGYTGDLYLPGCHVQHYKDSEMVKEIDAKDGTAQVCFAERPDVRLTIFYYVEEPYTASQIWLEQPTTHIEGFACAAAPYTGEYAPGSKIDTARPPAPAALQAEVPNLDGGSVAAPPGEAWITDSGTYNAGGVCSLIVLYREPSQTNDLHVADALRHDHDPVDDYDYADHDIFPDPDALLYQPGCHVLHYKDSVLTHWEKDETLGEWEICFAAQPGVEMTIYNYLGDLEDQASSWVPLETTVEGGMACAPAFHTGVYVPTGKK